MKTLLKKDGETTSFVFVDVEPAYQDAVQSLYYRPTDDGFAKTFDAATPHLDKIYQQFERHAVDVVLEYAEQKEVDWERSLGAFIDLIADHDIDWWLAGSASLAVRGLDIRPHDLDLIVSDESSQKLARILQDYLIEPLQLSPGWIWNSFGRAYVYGRLEWVGGVNAGADQPLPADYGPEAASRLDMVTWQGTEIRVPPLDLTLAVSERRGLNARIQKIREYMLLAN